MPRSGIAITDNSGTLINQQRYLPFGQVRTDAYVPNSPITSTDFGFTGQRSNSYINLVDYRFRWYSDQLGRFVSPDDIIPDPANPQSFNRYAYALNNPIRYNDPTGHCIFGLDTAVCVAALFVIGAVVLTGDTPRLRAGDAENVFDLIGAGLQHDKHANIVGAGLKSLQDDPSVQAAQGRLKNIIIGKPEYGKQAYTINDISDQFTANGPSGNWKQAAITGNQAFWMVHSGSISATNTKVSADGTISTTWHIHDDFNFIPGPNHTDTYNKLASIIYPIYNGLFRAEETYPTDAYWKQTIPPTRSCGRRCE